MKISSRVFVSFDEYCPYQCKHCYTYGIKRKKIRTVEEIVDSISNKNFDVIYVSQKNDNFSNPMKGLNLCRLLFQKYNSNIFIITRNVFNSTELNELEKLRTDMRKNGKSLFVAISLNAMASIATCEDVKRVCTPSERIDFIKRLHYRGFEPILMLRPIFPNQMIPISECIEIIEETYQFVSCIVTSGLGVNTDILKRLDKNESDFTYNEEQEYLQGAIDCDIKFINVRDEINKIQNKCNSLKVPLFEHSMPALNFLFNRAMNS